MSNATTLSYKCPNCGAPLLFDPSNESFKCEFCLSSFKRDEIDNTEAAKKAEQAVLANEEFCSGMNEYHCPSCGAQIVTDANTAADFCYYCHSPVVLSGRLSGAYAPTKIVPFKYSKEDAINKFKEFAKKKWFVPRDFKSDKAIEKITGIYFPFWVSDAFTDSQINARATKVRVYYSGDYKYTETSFYDVHRRGKISFEDIVNSACSDHDKAMLEGILPFPASAQLDFDMSYLSGFQAKKRDIDRSALEESFKRQLDTYSRSILRSTVHGYATVNIKDSAYNILKSHWDYSLMPIWVLTYKDKKGKVYTFAMNGYTGKVYGELPMSPKKITLGALITGAASFLATFLGGLLLI